MTTSLKDTLYYAESCLRETSRIAMMGPCRVAEKLAGELVTDADVAIEQALHAALKELFPHDSIFGEECGGVFSARTWIIDPIDGTSNFQAGVPFWCISVALWDGSCPLLGAVYDPNRDEMFTAISGMGAWLNGTKIRICNRNTLRRSMICFGLTAKRPASVTLEAVTNLANASCSIRAQGSGALSMCQIAAGRQHGFVEAAIHIWDVAASCIVLNEAGGWVDFDFEDSDPSSYFPIISGVPGIKHQLREATECLRIASSAPRSTT